MGKKQGLNKNSITVYWSPFSLPERNSLMNLIWDPPVPVLRTLPTITTVKDSTYMSCKSAQKLFKNTFTINHPLSTTVTMSGPINAPQAISTNNLWIPRPGAFDNSYTVNYDFSWLFFCEESLELRETHPYMHQVESSKTSYLSSGSLDIGKWFRPINLTYILWPNETVLSFKKGDIAAYFEFVTDKKVILKQFDLTPELYKLVNQVTSLKELFPNQSLIELYNRFTKGNVDKLILKHIKNNLIE
jgi:hypothetical protein